MKIPQKNYEENIRNNISADTLLYDLANRGQISKRTFNVCQKHKILIVSDIQKFGNNIEDFLSLRSCGRKTAIELFHLLQSLESNIQKNRKDLFWQSPEQIRNILNTWYNSIELEIKDKEFLFFFKEITLNIERTYDNLLINPIYFIKNKLYNSISNKKLKYLYRKYLVQYFAQLKNLLASSEFLDENIKLLNSHIIEIQDIVKKEFAIQHFKYDLLAEKQTLLILKLEELIDKAPTRAKTLHYSYIKDIEGLIPYLSNEINQFISNFGNKKKGAIEYYYNILLPFKEIYEHIVSEKEDNISFCIKYKFPFLNEQDINFVKDFLSCHKHYPMFFISKAMLVNSNKRDFDFLCRKLGIGKYKKPQSLEEIALSHSLTRERVRQILSKLHLQEIKLFNYEEWTSYFLLGNSIITEGSDYYQNINKSEELNMTFEAFGIIFCSVFKYDYVHSELEYIVDRNYSKQIQFILNSLLHLKKQHYSTNVCLTLKDIFSDNILRDDYLCNLIFTEICPLLEIEIKDDTLFFEQNHIDIPAEIFNFLYSCGEPKHIDDIKEYLSNKYPNKKFSLVNLKSKIREHSSILPVGNTSKYKLKHWRNVYGGSIRDLIRDILSESDKPLHLDIIADRVTDVYENTNKRNVQSSMSSSEDFEPYAKGLWGLKNKNYSEEYQRVDLSKTRNSFSDRFADYKKFVADFFRLPYQSGIEEEDSLKRWQTNVFKGLIDSTPEQINLLKNFINSNSHLPQNGRELKFQKTCKEYLDYVEDHYELPSPPSNLYYWFQKHVKIYDTYEDNRKTFFGDLISNLNAYGFYFKNKI